MSVEENRPAIQVLYEKVTLQYTYEKLRVTRD